MANHIEYNLSEEEFKMFTKIHGDIFLFSQFIKVIHPIKGKVPFNLYPYQKSVLLQFLKNRFNIILKFRQAGITELISMYCLWLAMFHPNKTVVIISIKDRVAKKVLRKIKYMYKNLPEYLQVKIVNGRAGEYGCVTEDTVLVGESGDFPIGDITPLEKGIKDISHLGIRVLSHKGTFERILTTINKGVLKTFEIINDRGDILRCTPDHRLYTTSGWKTVEEILERNLTCIFWDSKYLDGIYIPKTKKPKKEIILETKYKGYFVSNWGNVYTSRYLTKRYPDKLYKMTLKKSSHLRARFKIEGKGKFFSVHRLVWETFKGQIKPGYIIDHIDCNREHNYLTNLQEITSSENNKRAHLHNRVMKNKNYIPNNISLKDLGRLKRLSKKYGTGYGTGKRIADKLKITTKEVSHYRRGESLNHIYVSNIRLVNITKETIVDMEVENNHSYITKSNYVNHNTAQEMEFINGSTISSIPTTEDAGRSEAVSLLVIDEAAIVRWANQIWAAAFPTLSTGGAAIVNSTPYGIGNWYHSQWVNAVAQGNDFAAIRLHWQMHPERDMAWYNSMKDSLGTRRTGQEIDGDFLASGHSVFDLSDIKGIEDMLSENIPIETRMNGALRIFERPRKKSLYYMGADVATGRSRDYSAFSIMDRLGEEVVCFKGKISVDKFADLLNEFGLKYNRALLAPESNDIGLAVTNKLQSLNYPNLYYSSKILKEKGTRKAKLDKIPGWLTTSKNRPVIIDELEQDIRNEEVIIKDAFFVQEAYTFIYDETNRPVALGKNKRSSGDAGELDEQTYTDDSILAKAITNFIRKGKKKTIIVSPQ